MNELALFAGAGGGILGGHLLGWRTICAVEYEPYPASVLAQRQNDGLLPPFPIWDDVCTFDGKPWRGLVDVVSGGFPCQDISTAGKGAGITGERSGLWSEMARIICEVEPRYVLVENSPALTSRGLGVVLGDLAAMGFDAKWGVLGADDVGAPHRRKRIWILAHANRTYREGVRKPFRVSESDSNINVGSSGGVACEDVVNTESLGLQRPGVSSKGSRPQESAITGGGVLADSMCKRQQGQREYVHSGNCQENSEGQTGNALHVSQSRVWPTEPSVGRVVNGVAGRMDRLKALGNGQVPRVAARAWRCLNGDNDA